MTDWDARLTAALRAGAPPARDVKFRVEALVRLERMRFRRRVTLAVAAGSLAALFAAVNAPLITAWLAEDVQRLWILLLACAAAMFALALQPIAASPGLRAAVSSFGRWFYGDDA